LHIAKVRGVLSTVVTADFDGEIRCWDISQHLLNWRVQGHKGRVIGLTVTNTTETTPRLVISTGIDSTIKVWRLNPKENVKRSLWERDDAKETHLSYIANKGEDYGGNSQRNITTTTTKPSNPLAAGGLTSTQMAEYGAGDQLPISTIKHWEPLRCVDANWQQNTTQFATGSESVMLWDVHRTHALHTYAATPEQCTDIAFNPGQHNVLATTMQDSKITFYDTRAKTQMPYITILNWANEIRWNPIDPRIFAVATNDWCCYTFDIRHTKRAIKTHRGHVDAVTSIDWSPAGREFVSCAVDGHIRIWKSDHQASDAMKVGYSRELYKGKRMYNLAQVRWTNDNKYILSGSADGALRLWKARRAEPLHRINARQRASIHYSQRLAEKYSHLDEIALISKFRNAKVPHRIPRNGVFYKTERFNQKTWKQLKEQLNPTTKEGKEKRKREQLKTKGSKPFRRLKRWQREKQESWAQKVVVRRGIVMDHQE